MVSIIFVVLAIAALVRRPISTCAVVPVAGEHHRHER
jgi:hypothetical protein